MSIWTFATFNRQFIELLEAKENVQAFELLEKAQTAFPEQIYHLTYWRIGVHALMGKQEEATRRILLNACSRGWRLSNKAN